jgi:hypothetical protein
MEILELQTSVTRQIVRIDGTDYELLNGDELGLRDYLWMRETGKKLADIEIENLSEAQVDELSSALDVVTEKSLLAPKEVRDKLTDTQKMKIMTFFLRTLRQQKSEGTTASFPDSKDSTEGVPANG